jgi:hypothetical protein
LAFSVSWAAFCAQPVTIGKAQKAAQPQIRISSYGALTVNNFAYAPGRYANLPGQTVLAYFHWFEEFLKQKFTGCYRSQLFHKYPQIGLKYR